MTIAQKGGPPDKLPPYCLEEYREKIGNCNKDDCKAECTRKRNGHGLCAGALEQESCICTYQPKNKRNPFQHLIVPNHHIQPFERFD
ncbi:hypothetical protein YC2023_055687 [Brassica napus]